ncbi:cyclopropane-fatty-acyl-phospholipid synthase family protein [uncultured Acinetobacter sp.]|uniref:SAM-dependent methyltransferase n=1 Tax=uncultured Acinetobacter sp. TaxID=165433 RepID=UPI0025866A63|nr:cyclopropane-fatty-acyl-phospholipid synthase family protein [uncultured Acinetobacter sp.]
MDFIIQQSLKLVESGLVPDQAIRAAIRALSKKRLIQEGRYDPEQAAQRYMDVLNTLKHSEIAIETDKANEQHYELPTEFFQAALGKRLKYSACYFPTTKTTLDEAEEFALQIYCERAQLKDGQQILELGCGWGSFTLWMAERYPNASIKGVSNSATQRQHILAQAKQRGLNNIEILTCDVNVLELEKGQFDRVVSVEMFEHVRNYQRLFEKIQTWLKDDGLLWCHIFCHRFLHYPFEIKNEYDWMSKYFFTGGLMPSVSTFLHFQDHLELSQQWQWSGEHYERTANAWLENMDAHETELKPLFEKIYAQDADAWWQRWRIFFMACAELFGFDQGQEWVVGHYLFKKKTA